MTRSVWKGPFVDGYLLKKAERSRASARKEIIKIWSRRSTILPQFVGLTFGVHNGQKHIPVLVTEDMPDVATDAFAIAFGDFRAGYTIAERPDLRVLRDPFSAKPHVLFYATKRVGGDVSDFAAIKLLKFGTA